eukprot:4204145-Amphidinium_carterae.2
MAHDEAAAVAADAAASDSCIDNTSSDYIDWCYTATHHEAEWILIYSRIIRKATGHLRLLLDVAGHGPLLGTGGALCRSRAS